MNEYLGGLSFLENKIRRYPYKIKEINKINKITFNM